MKTDPEKLGCFSSSKHFAAAAAVVDIYHYHETNKQKTKISFSLVTTFFHECNLWFGSIFFLEQPYENCTWEKKFQLEQTINVFSVLFLLIRCIFPGRLFPPSLPQNAAATMAFCLSSLSKFQILPVSLCQPGVCVPG